VKFVQRLFVAIMLTATISAAGVAQAMPITFAWCGTPQAEPTCPEFHNPKPTYETLPPAPPAATAVLPAAPSALGSLNRSNVCAYTLENGIPRVDVKSVSDANRWIAEHSGRTNLPDDFVPASGQMCGVTLILPAAVPTASKIVVATPTPVPAIVTVVIDVPATTEDVTPPAAPQPCWQTNSVTGEYVFDIVEDTETGDITYVPIPCGSNPTPATPQVDTPTDLPNTGDADALAYCSPSETADWQQWWDYVGQYVCP
jgi:hypothetical protein